MKFKIEKKHNPNRDKYHQEDYDLALDFSKKILKEFGSFIKAVVLFGSSAREPKGHNNDVDILAVVDDISVQLSPQMIETYRVMMETLIAETSKRLHVTTLRLTSYWEYVRVGDPVGLNILRDGVALLDTGIFEPMRLLLYQGRIRPSEEASLNYFARAPVTLHNSRWHIMQGTMDLYWAVIDAAHGAVMKTGMIPPAPAEMAKVLKEKFVDTGRLNKKYPKIMQQFYDLSKSMMHKRVLDITGQQYEKYYSEAKEFIEEMRKIVVKK